MRHYMAAISILALGLAAMPAKANLGQDRPQVTQLLLDKSARALHLLNGRKVIRTYRVDLGRNPKGHKQFQGDGRTPEGLYYITHRNPNSAFYLSLGISYPNEQDRRSARNLGRNPGGDIFIHGRGPKAKNPPKDWTRGCPAVTDPDMAEIYDLVAPGTPIYIKP